MLSEKVADLEKDLEFANKKIAAMCAEIGILRRVKGAYENLCKMVIPAKVYSHKERRNTTVKFEDGSQVTVKRRPGEKNCLETAIAYCILKQLVPAKKLRQLIDEREEH